MRDTHLGNQFMLLLRFRISLVKSALLNEEETRLGIPDELVGHSIFRANIPDVCCLQNLPQIYDSHGESPH